MNNEIKTLLKADSNDFINDNIKCPKCGKIEKVKCGL
jgi:phage FluMu protein Com